MGQVYIGSASTPTTPGTLTVSGIPGQPKGLIILAQAAPISAYQVGQTVTTNTYGTMSWCFVGTDGSIRTLLRNGLSFQQSAYAIHILNPLIQATFVGFTSDGFQLDFTNVQPTSYVFHYIAFYGDDVEVSVTLFGLPGYGSSTFVSLPFTPDALILGTVFSGALSLGWYPFRSNDTTCFSFCRYYTSSQWLKVNMLIPPSQKRRWVIRGSASYMFEVIKEDNGFQLATMTAPTSFTGTPSDGAFALALRGVSFTVSQKQQSVSGPGWSTFSHQAPGIANGFMLIPDFGTVSSSNSDFGLSTDSDYTSIWGYLIGNPSGAWGGADGRIDAGYNQFRDYRYSNTMLVHSYFITATSVRLDSVVFNTDTISTTYNFSVYVGTSSNTTSVLVITFIDPSSIQFHLSVSSSSSKVISRLRSVSRQISMSSNKQVTLNTGRPFSLSVSSGSQGSIIRFPRLPGIPPDVVVGSIPITQATTIDIQTPFVCRAGIVLFSREAPNADLDYLNPHISVGFFALRDDGNLVQFSAQGMLDYVSSSSVNVLRSYTFNQVGNTRSGGFGVRVTETGLVTRFEITGSSTERHRLSYILIGGGDIDVQAGWVNPPSGAWSQDLWDKEPDLLFFLGITNTQVLLSAFAREQGGTISGVGGIPVVSWSGYNSSSIARINLIESQTPSGIPLWMSPNPSTVPVANLTVSNGVTLSKSTGPTFGPLFYLLIRRVPAWFERTRLTYQGNAGLRSFMVPFSKGARSVITLVPAWSTSSNTYWSIAPDRQLAILASDIFRSLGFSVLHFAFPDDRYLGGHNQDTVVSTYLGSQPSDPNNVFLRLRAFDQRSVTVDAYMPSVDVGIDLLNLGIGDPVQELPSKLVELVGSTRSLVTAGVTQLRNRLLAVSRSAAASLSTAVIPKAMELFLQARSVVSLERPATLFRGHAVGSPHQVFLDNPFARDLWAQTLSAVSMAHSWAVKMVAVATASAKRVQRLPKKLLGVISPSEAAASPYRTHPLDLLVSAAQSARLIRSLLRTLVTQKASQVTTWVYREVIELVGSAAHQAATLLGYPRELATQSGSDPSVGLLLSLVLHAASSWQALVRRLIEKALTVMSFARIPGPRSDTWEGGEEEEGEPGVGIGWSRQLGTGSPSEASLWVTYFRELRARSLQWARILTLRGIARAIRAWLWRVPPNGHQ